LPVCLFNIRISDKIALYVNVGPTDMAMKTRLNPTYVAGAVMAAIPDASFLSNNFPLPCKR